MERPRTQFLLLLLAAVVLGAAVTAGRAQGAGEPAPRPELLGHVALNLNHFADPAAARLNAQYVRRHLALLQRHGVRGDYYFTWLAAKELAAADPRLLDDLRAAGMGLEHHGANRPPRPMPVDRCQGRDWAEDVAAIEAYEAHDLDPASGELLSGVGGLRGLGETFGVRPLSTGRFLKAPCLFVAKEYGVRMAVGLAENVGAPEGFAWYLGVLNRPEGVPLAPSVWLPRPGGAEKGLANVKAALARLDPKGRGFVALLVHDSDFLGLKIGGTGGPAARPAPEELRERTWAAYEQTLTWLTDEAKVRFVPLAEVWERTVDDRARTLTRAEVRTGCGRLLAQDRTELPLWIDLGGGDGISLSDLFQALVAQLGTADGAAAERVTVRDLAGPRSAVESGLPALMAATALPRVSAADVKEAATRTHDWITDRLPASVTVAGRRVNAAEFLLAMTQVAAGPADAVVLHRVEAIPGGLARNGKVDTLTALQFWTYKPARWKD